MFASSKTAQAASMVLAVTYPDGRVKTLGRLGAPPTRFALLRPLRALYYNLIEKPAFNRARKAHNREMLAAHPDNTEFAALVARDEGAR